MVYRVLSTSKRWLALGFLNHSNLLAALRWLAGFVIFWMNTLGIFNWMFQYIRIFCTKFLDLSSFPLLSSCSWMNFVFCIVCTYPRLIPSLWEFQQSTNEEGIQCFWMLLFVNIFNLGGKMVLYIWLFYLIIILLVLLLFWNNHQSLGSGFKHFFYI